MKASKANVAARGGFGGTGREKGVGYTSRFFQRRQLFLQLWVGECIYS